MISISERAKEALSQLLKEKEASADQGLRLAVHRGGCAGWQYEMKVAAAEEGDHVGDFGEVKVIVAADSLDKLRDCEVDYEDSLSDAGFRIKNPRAARSCGCGTSFEDTGEDPGEIEECGS